MAEILQFFNSYELWIYGLLVLVGLVYLSRFIHAWDEMRQASFGLEHESAHQRLSQAATGMVLLVLLAIAEFTLVTFIIPIVPESTPMLTPTLDLLATPTLTLVVQSTQSISEGTATMEQPLGSEGLVVPTLPGDVGGCVADQVMISDPKNGSGVSGLVPISGTADIPNFGFYKFEFSSPGQPSWTAIQAWTEPKKNDTLGQWDTSRLTEGLYLLRLVVTDNQGKAATPCVIQLTILKTEQ